MEVGALVAKILVIDDDPDLRMILRRILEAHGHEVILGEDGLRGLAVAQRQRPDAIVLDVMMPVMDGFEVLDRLQRDDRTLHVPVVMLTALAVNDARERCEEAGAASFVEKPYDPTDLVTTIERVVAAAASR